MDALRRRPKRLTARTCGRYGVTPNYPPLPTFRRFRLPILPRMRRPVGRVEWHGPRRLMLELIDDIFRHVRAGERVALCAVVESRGSTPQAAGAAMAVFADGRSLGTLGGGCVEAEVRARALRMIHADGGQPPVMRFKLDSDYGWDDGLVCGGIMDVAVQMLANDADLAPLATLRDALGRREATTYAFTGIDADGATRRFELPFAPRQALVIAGAGHIGQALAEVAHRCEFAVTVVDDRADVASAERFPNATRIVGEIDRALAGLAIDAHTFVVIVTRGHRHDSSALAAVIDSPARYVGMIGSKRKVRTILDELATRGIARDRLICVHAPIGLELGAISPGEIAVSIVAELIAVRRGQQDALAASLKIDAGELATFLDRGQLRSPLPRAGGEG